MRGLYLNGINQICLLLVRGKPCPKGPERKSNRGSRSYNIHDVCVLWFQCVVLVVVMDHHFMWSAMYKWLLIKKNTGYSFARNYVFRLTKTALIEKLTKFDAHENWWNHSISNCHGTTIACLIHVRFGITISQLKSFVSFC